jgi:hypothetical protein
MEFLLPDLKLPDIKKFPEPVINYLAPMPPTYPTVLVPSYRPGKASIVLPKATPKGPIPEPPPKTSVAEEIVKDVVDAVTPTLEFHTEAIGSLRTDLDNFKIEVEEKETESSEVVNSVEIPGGIQIPLPKPEILVAAGTTATVSVAATLTATALFKKCVTAFKPVIKKVIILFQTKKGEKPPTWSRQRLALRRHRSQNKDSLV